MTTLNLNTVREFLLSKLGLYYDKKHERALMSKLSKAAIEFNFRDTNKFIEWLLKQEMNASQTKLLASSLTIGETYFFREEQAIDYLRLVFLPELIKQRKDKNKKIRIWSAGCSTGEEPYSLAITLQQTLPDYKSWDITILASDINPNFLNKARIGIYSNWSFRKTPESFKSKYFKAIDKNNYQIIDSVKEMVSFTHLNLASDDYPSPTNNTNNYDAIFCRNVLIYFSNDGINAVSKKFYKALNPDGMLAVSPVETPNFLNSSFFRVNVNGNTLFRKYANVNQNVKLKTLPKVDLARHRFPMPSSKKVSNPILKAKAQKTGKEITATKSLQVKKSTSVEDGTKSYKKALEYYAAGNFIEAETQLKKVEPKDKTTEQKILLLQARICADTNHLDKSEQCCTKVLEIDKINTEAHYLLATVYSEQEKYHETIQALNNLLFLNPDYVAAHFLLGNTYLKIGNVKYGVKHLCNAKKCLSKLNDNEIINDCDGLTALQLTMLIDGLSPNNLGIKSI